MHDRVYRLLFLYFFLYKLTKIFLHRVCTNQNPCGIIITVVKV
nr:MAG TPA: hypothetical protein [Caudoviricetes sp.]